MKYKKEGCEHQFEHEPYCAPAFHNVYSCPTCRDYAWSDTWSCACNDRCPICNTECEPIQSIQIGDCACEVL